VVDWDRVEELKQKGWDWNRIAADPKVAFHPDTSVQQAGPALRRLYYRRQSRSSREAPAAPSKKVDPNVERKWTIARVGYLLTPIFGLWFLIAYLAPSPVGLLVAAIPWLAIGLAIGAFLLAFGLLRTSKRWTKAFRTTLILGIVGGLAIAGVIGLAGSLIYGCPYLPPSSALTTQSASGQSSQSVPAWQSGGMAAWQDGGKPVIYYYGATWCPYCSSASWSIWKAISEFSTSLTNVQTGFSSLTDVYPGTPEMNLANAAVTSSSISFRVSEDTSGVSGTFPGTSNCYEQAYVSAYSGGGIPFEVINGQIIHQGQLVPPGNLAAYTYSSTGGTGAAQMQQQVQNENGTGWNQVSFQTYWIMAFIAHSLGTPVVQLEAQYHWSPVTAQAVQADVVQIT
jgi:thiol-disulfide isomerase/thioredoxin